MSGFLEFERRSEKKGSLALSLVVHVIVIAMIASITFRYPLEAFLGLTHEPAPVVETLHFVKVVPRVASPVGNGAAERPTARPRKGTPAQLVAPTTIPTAIPPIPPPSVSQGAISGKPGGYGGAPSGVATGIEPEMPDPRLEMKPGKYSFPKSEGQRADSAVRAIFEIYREAVLAAQDNPTRSPRDWTIEKNGKKYGLDSQYVYLGRFKLPSAILAALPFNTAGVDGDRLIRGRNADWIRQDILSHAQGLSEDDFRAAVKRIRERKEREHQEEEKAKATAGKPLP